MYFIDLSTTSHPCPCGCGSSLQLVQGGFEYGDNSNVAFRTALLDCQALGPHVFTQLGSGAWDGKSPGTWWTTLHTWIDDSNLVTRVVDPAESPLARELAPEGLLLSRAEVLAQGGAREWACEVAGEISVHHEAISSFILSRYDERR